VGSFNDLHVETTCRRCDQIGKRTLQIKYGECWQYKYQIGDSVQWATGSRRNLNKGSESEARAWVPAYSSACPHCNDGSDFADFSVVVDGSRIEGVVQAPIGFRFREDQEVVALATDASPNGNRSRPNSCEHR
jgi:hypothetical protein